MVAIFLLQAAVGVLLGQSAAGAGDGTARSQSLLPAAGRAPTGTALASGGWYGRGDADCSLTWSAVDVVAQTRALGGESGCGNDDCDRDGSVTAGDVDCAARCLFGPCPVPPHAPRVTGATPESAPGIVPYSTIRLSGTNFGTDETPHYVSIGGQHGEVVGRDGGDMLVVVPDLAPGTRDLVFAAGDVAGPPVPVTIEAAQPIGAPDSFVDLTAQIGAAVTLILGLDVEAIYGDNAPIVRRELEGVEGELAAAVAALSTTPGFDELRGPLDAAIEGSGLPEQLRDSLAALQATQAGVRRAAAVPAAAGATRQVATVIYVTGRVTVYAATRVLAAAAAAVPAPAAAGAAAVGAIAAKVVVAGIVIGAVVGAGILLTEETPVINAYEPQIVEPGGLLTLHGQGFGRFVEPNLVLLFKQSGATMTVRDAEETGENLLKFRIPDEVGACGQAEMYLEVPLIGTRAPSNLPLQIRPVLVNIDHRVVKPTELLRMDVKGVAGCNPDAAGRLRVTTFLQQTEGDGTRWDTAITRQVPAQPGQVETAIPGVVPGAHDVFLELNALESGRKPLAIDTDIERLRIDCDRTELEVGKIAKCNTVPVGKRSVFPTGSKRLDYSVSPSELLEVVASNVDLGGVWFVGRRPGTATVDATLRRSDIDPPRFIAETGESLQLTVIEKNAPTVSLRSDTPEIVTPGATIQVTANAEDDFEMQRIVLNAAGNAVPAGLREQTYDCPLAGTPGASRKCAHEFQITLQATNFQAGPITVAATAVDGSGNAGTSNQLVFRFEQGEVTGTVYDAETRDPIQNVTVQLLNASGAIFDTLVSGGGAFLFENVPVGSYTLTAAATGYETEDEPIVVQADTATVVDLFLQPEPVSPVTVEFRKIADTPPPPSGSTDRFPQSAVEDGTVVYTFLPYGGREGKGIYVNRGGGEVVVADTTNIIPDTQQTFGAFWDLALDGNLVAFTTTLNGRMYRRNLNVPNYPDAVEEFLRLPGNFPNPYIMLYEGGRAAFGLGSPSTSQQRAVWTAEAGIAPPDQRNLRLVANTNTAIPGSQGTFTVFRYNGDQDVAFEATGAGLGADTVVFIGEGESGQAGVYRSAGGGALGVLADTNTPMPDGLGPFDGFCGVAMDGEAVIFKGRRTTPAQEGIYMVSDGGLSVVADRRTAVPGQSSMFRSFDCHMAFDAGIVALKGTPDRGDGQGVYLDIGGTLVKIATDADTLDGRVVKSVLLDDDDSLDGDGDEGDGIDVVFEVFFEDDWNALYLATVR